MLLDHPLSVFYEATHARVLDVLLASELELSGREVARRSQLAPTTAIRALQSLEESGIIQSRSRGRSQLWSLRDDSAFVAKLRTLGQVQDDEAARVIVEALGEEPVSVTLFGSTARGESSAASDIDVLVVARDKDQDRLFRRRAYTASTSLRRLVGRPVQLTVMSRGKFRHDVNSPFVQGVIRDGRALRGADVRDLVP